MGEKRFKVIDDDFSKWIVDTTLKEDKHEGAIYTAYDMCRKLNELFEENEQLRLELETHKHPLWSTREAEKKVNKLADSLADEVKKNGLLNEEINQLRIENMRLKKRGKLEEENEELKQQLVDVTKSIDSLCNRVDKSNRSNEFKWGAIMGLRTLQGELKGDGV